MQRIFKFFINFIRFVDPCPSFKYTLNPAKCFTSGIIEFLMERCLEQSRTAGGKNSAKFTKWTIRDSSNYFNRTPCEEGKLITMLTSEREERNYFHDSIRRSEGFAERQVEFNNRKVDTPFAIAPNPSHYIHRAVATHLLPSYSTDLNCWTCDFRGLPGKFIELSCSNSLRV